MGFDVDQQISALPAVLNAALAGQIELGQSADIVSNIMTGFGISAEDAGMAVDVLVKASTTANTDIPMLGEGMKYVAPVAASLGWSIEETAAAIGKLSDAGIQGSQSGTVLRQALLSLANPVGQTADAMKDLNIEVLDANGNMKPMPELIGHISDRFEGMTDAQKTQAAAQLVGTNAAAGFLALLDQGEDVLADYVKELENSAGAAQEMADIQKDTLVGSFKEFQSAMEEAGIKLGNEFLPVFTDLVRYAADVVSSFDDVNAGQVKSALVFGGTAATIGLTISTIGKLVLAVKGLMVSMGPAGWLITGISVLGGMFAAASSSSETLSDSVERLSQEFDELQSLDEKIDEFDKLSLKSQLTNEEFERFVDLTDLINRTTDPTKLQELKDEQEKLYKKSGLSNDELDRMVDLNGDLIEIMPESTDKISAQGNAILETTDALKEYSKEKLESLYEELDLKRLALEREYKDALKEEERIIRRKKDLHGELLDLQDVQNEKQQILNREQDKLNDMKNDSNMYSDIEIQKQQEKVNWAETELRKAEDNVGLQADKILKQDKSLEKIREEIKDYEELSQRMIDVILKQEGLTAEKGEGLKVVEKEIRKLKNKRRDIVNNTKEQMKNTDEYRNSLSEIDRNIERLQGVYGEISDIISNTRNMNAELGRGINKSVHINYTHSGNPTAPHLRGPTPIYHEGGVVGMTKQLPKLHTGGLTNNLFDRPLHNEVDARLLRREMVLTEGQQANLWRMLEQRSSPTSTNDDVLYELLNASLSQNQLLSEILQKELVAVVDFEPYYRMTKQRLNEDHYSYFKQRRK